MEFPANAAAERQRMIFLRVLFLIAVALAFFYGFLLFFVVLIALAMKSLSRSEKRMIRIDETGIRCRRGNQTQWYFLWDEINSIRRSRHMGVRCLDLQINAHSQMDDTAFRRAKNMLYFEECSEATTCLEAFSPQMIE